MEGENSIHGQISVDDVITLNKVLYGNESRSDLTCIYEGTLGGPIGRKVAVKRIKYLVVPYSEIEEIKLIRESDVHENLIQFFVSGKRIINKCLHQFIVLELCDCSLLDWVEGKDSLPDIIKNETISSIGVLDQINLTNGVNFLHFKKVVHRNLNSSNVLLKVIQPNHVKVRICDFGFDRKLPAFQLGFMPETMRYMAPQIRKAVVGKEDPRAYFTFESDIYSLGCIFSYVLSHGKQLFEEMISTSTDSTQAKINKSCPQLLVGNTNLVLSTTHEEPEHRPTTSLILKHHVFWTPSRILNFFVDVSNLCDGKSKKKLPKHIRKCVDAANKMFRSAHNISSDDVQEGWRLKVNASVQLYMKIWEKKMWEKKQIRKPIIYEGNCVMRLIRLIRNINNHPKSLSKELLDEVKWTANDKIHPDDFVYYWMAIFPFLLDNIWFGFQTLKDNSIQKYYAQNEKYEFRSYMTELQQQKVF